MAAVDVRALLIEGAVDASASMAGYLRRSGIDVRTQSGAARLGDVLASSAFDVLLLESALPDAAAADACREVRRHSAIPVIALFDREDWAARVDCLDCGADDCLCRPFDPRELVARITSLVRRNGGRRYGGAQDEMPAAMAIDGWLLEAARRRLVMPDGRVVLLSAIEFRLLWTLVSRPGRVLSRERLCAAVDPTAALSERALDSSLSRLRRKLGPGAALIRTVRGEGFVFDGAASPARDD
jgi:two-component system, OmpR family, response regulator